MTYTLRELSGASAVLGWYFFRCRRKGLAISTRTVWRATRVWYS